MMRAHDLLEGLDIPTPGGTMRVGCDCLDCAKVRSINSGLELSAHRNRFPDPSVSQCDLR